MLKLLVCANTGCVSGCLWNKVVYIYILHILVQYNKSPRVGSAQNCEPVL